MTLKNAYIHSLPLRQMMIMTNFLSLATQQNYKNIHRIYVSTYLYGIILNNIQTQFIHCQCKPTMNGITFSLLELDITTPVLLKLWFIFFLYIVQEKKNKQNKKTFPKIMFHYCQMELNLKPPNDI